MGDLYYQSIDSLLGNRVMVIGQNVATVQRVSRYCIDRGAEVFPYYGLPSDEEVALFDPEVSVLCLPLPEDFIKQIDRPYIFWSEEKLIDFSLVSDQKAVKSSLQNILQLN
jgi:hypothetical protein